MNVARFSSNSRTNIKHPKIGKPFCLWLGWYYQGFLLHAQDYFISWDTTKIKFRLKISPNKAVENVESSKKFVRKKNDFAFFPVS